MGFDKDDTRPVVDVTRRTTKVNVWIIVAVVAFFVATGIVVWTLSNDPSAAQEVVPTP